MIDHEDFGRDGIRFFQCARYQSIRFDIGSPMAKTGRVRHSVQRLVHEAVYALERFTREGQELQLPMS